MSRNRVMDVNDKRLDKFYDETPSLVFRVHFFTTTHGQPFELVYRERLDGTSEENRQRIDNIATQAQADIYNMLLRLQAADDECEFSKWIIYDDQGATIRESTTLTVHVKPQVGKKS